MTRSRRSAVLALLLAALAGSPAPSHGQAADIAVQRRLLVDQRDPDAAERFLDGAALQASLKAQDEGAYLELFRAATELRDLRQMLRGYQREKRVLREGLAARPDCSFCQDSRRLLAWSARWHAAPDDLLRKAVFEWDSLPDARRRWLIKRGVSRASWDGTRFVDRLAKLREWAEEERAAIMKAVPRTAQDLERLRDRASDVDEYLDHDDAYGLDERLARDEAAVEALADAEKRLARATDPKLKAALAAAEKAGDLETRLARLGEIFDGLHVPNAALHTAAPMPAGQGFDDATAKLVADMLGPALLRETRGTRAGDDLEAFYAKTPMTITLKPEPSGNLATYFGGTLNFGRGDIEDFLKARGRSARDLTTQPALLGDLARELAPVFVHEATHHRQDVWAQDKGIKDSWSQYQEIEAMETEAAFVLEKSAIDPSYRAYLERVADNDPNAREAMGLARRLETQGPDQFRRSIRALHYPGLLSLEGETWSRIVTHRRVAEYARAELARRDGLPAAEQAGLEKKGGKLERAYGTPRELRDAVRGLGTPELKAALAGAEASAAKTPDFYAQHRARQQEADRAAEKVLADLASGKRKTRFATVPAPVMQQ